ncbi:MAG: tRNA (adenosine(37)-N6)-threonylcarbamoyltransferase complex ATPase subunit type 1 TsaE [Bacteroidia bacterium]
MRLVFEETALPHVVQRVWDAGKSFSRWSVVGPMGAGKTTLLSHLFRHLGIEEPVQSPTFTYIHRYTSSLGPLYHVDLFRVQQIPLSRWLDIIGLWESGAYVFVEWADLYADWERPYWKIELSEGPSPQYRELLAQAIY